MSAPPPTPASCDAKGRCPRHPTIQLARKKALGRGWKTLLSHCPMCAMEALVALDDGGGGIRAAPTAARDGRRRPGPPSSPASWDGGGGGLRRSTSCDEWSAVTRGSRGSQRSAVSAPAAPPRRRPPSSPNSNSGGRTPGQRSPPADDARGRFGPAEDFVCGMALFPDDEVPAHFYTGQVHPRTRRPHGLGTLRSPAGRAVAEGVWRHGSLVAAGGGSQSLHPPPPPARPPARMLSRPEPCVEATAERLSRIDSIDQYLNALAPQPVRPSEDPPERGGGHARFLRDDSPLRDGVGPAPACESCDRLSPVPTVESTCEGEEESSFSSTSLADTLHYGQLDDQFETSFGTHARGNVVRDDNDPHHFGGSARLSAAHKNKLVDFTQYIDTCHEKEDRRRGAVSSICGRPTVGWSSPPRDTWTGARGGGGTGTGRGPPHAGRGRVRFQEETA